MAELKVQRQVVCLAVQTACGVGLRCPEAQEAQSRRPPDSLRKLLLIFENEKTEPTFRDIKTHQNSKTGQKKVVKIENQKMSQTDA